MNKLIIFISFLLHFLLLVSQSQGNENAEYGLNPDKLDVLYYGFEFDEGVVARSIRDATDYYLSQTFEQIPEFANFLINVTNSAGLNSTWDYFQKPVDPNTGDHDPFYHVTTKFCGNDQAACSEYESKNHDFIGKTFEMHLAGLVITNRTYGVRINLTKEQEALFDNNEKLKHNENVILTYQDLRWQVLPGIRLESVQPYPPPIPVTTSRAHMTLGCAPGIPAVTTGPDLLQTISLEERAAQNPEIVTTWDNMPDPIDVEERSMRVSRYMLSSSPFHDQIFVIYPRFNIVANATLKPYFKLPNPPTTYQPTSPSSASNYYSYTLFNENSPVVRLLQFILKLLVK